MRFYSTGVIFLTGVLILNFTNFLKSIKNLSAKIHEWVKRSIHTGLKMSFKNLFKNGKPQIIETVNPLD